MGAQDNTHATKTSISEKRRFYRGLRAANDTSICLFGMDVDWLQSETVLVFEEINKININLQS